MRRWKFHFPGMAVGAAKFPAYSKNCYVKAKQSVNVGAHWQAQHVVDKCACACLHLCDCEHCAGDQPCSARWAGRADDASVMFVSGTYK